LTDERQYPYELDCVWLASDRDGNVGAFVTGGVGPIPVLCLDPERFPVEDIEARILELPVASTARLVVTLKRPDDFVSFAQRGLFAYDWSDVHRVRSEAIHAYEQIAVPEAPLKVADLPAEMLPLVIGIVLDVAFERASRIDLTGQVDCREALC